MKQEFDLIRKDAVPGAEREPFHKLDTNGARREIREATDEFIADGLHSDSIPGLLWAAPRVMLGIAQVLDRAGLDPNVVDLVEAATALVEDARSVTDKGLMLRDPATANCGAVMVEIVVHGVCSVLGLSYDRALQFFHAGDREGFIAYLNANKEQPQ